MYLNQKLNNTEATYHHTYETFKAMVTFIRHFKKHKWVDKQNIRFLSGDYSWTITLRKTLYIIIHTA